MAENDSPGNMVGSGLSFIDADDPDLVISAPEHPAVELLERAITELRNNRPVLVAELLSDAMAVIAERDGIMCEF